MLVVLDYHFNNWHSLMALNCELCFSYFRHDLAFSSYEASLAQKAQLSPDVLASLFEIAAFHNLAPDADFDTLRPSEIEETEEQNSNDILNRDRDRVLKG